jgi:hypothetical protein
MRFYGSPACMVQILSNPEVKAEAGGSALDALAVFRDVADCRSLQNCFLGRSGLASAILRSSSNSSAV